MIPCFLLIPGYDGHVFLVSHNGDYKIFAPRFAFGCRLLFNMIVLCCFVWVCCLIFVTCAALLNNILDAQCCAVEQSHCLSISHGLEKQLSISRFRSVHTGTRKMVNYA
ncbi:hypothetical protein T4C_4622 [Trichinella pseudospiralis]|uniref:Uncharacterized protein n=1 Tax=Trichinella pseudospiralis TaxID=6337 RepID=A0A0V1JM92_TRIPS|nr:hypothetical protein T4C_4622 [Trichinella pseudospiralis]